MYRFDYSFVARIEKLKSRKYLDSHWRQTGLKSGGAEFETYLVKFETYLVNSRLMQ